MLSGNLPTAYLLLVLLVIGTFKKLDICNLNLFGARYRHANLSPLSPGTIYMHLLYYVRVMVEPHWSR